MLTDVEIQNFINDGYVIRKNVLREDEMRYALKKINNSIGHVGIDAANMKTKAQSVFCRELTHDEGLLALANKGSLAPLAMQLTGPHLVPVEDVQIALRFPIGDSTRCPMIPHIDGTYEPGNGMNPDQLFSFTLLAVAFLSDVPNSHSGNFTVYPGSHLLLQDYFAAHGADLIRKGLPADLDVGPPRQITASKGDVVLTHYMLAHTVAPHRTHNIRYAMIYRFKHARHDGNKPRQAVSIWEEYEGITNAV